MFRTDLLSIIRSLDTAFTTIGICHTSVMIAGEVGMEVIPTSLVSLSETRTVIYQNKFEK
jgi:hypothetical protein